MAKSVHIPMTGGARDALIGTSVLLALFATTVFFRLLGRFQGVGIGADDILSTLALILSSTTIGMCTAVFLTGVGHDLDPKSPLFPTLMVNMPYIMQMTFAYTLVYIWTLACLKLSQLTLYNRVFSGQLKLWIWTGIAAVFCWALIFTFVMVFLCTPITQQWSLQRIGKCMDQILVLKSLIMTNVITDCYIFILPIRAVWKLQMRKTEKLAIISCFALGAACVIIGIVRFWQIFVIDLIGNLTGTSLTTFMLVTMELMLGGLCINIPMLRPFYTNWRKAHNSSQGSSHGKASYVTTDSGLFAERHGGTQGHAAWIELENENGHDSDAGSQRKLTKSTPNIITVSKDWTITTKN